MALHKVLVANRGEIALRVIRACHEEGIAAVAVYSQADRDSVHVRAADEGVEIGPPAPAESYLCIDRIVEAALESGADAIHPGYGFLAERAEFVAAVTKAGLVFIGPPMEAMVAMGEKTEARRRMTAAGVAIVPGTTAAMPDGESALRAANEIGYPVMLKAAAGGGGKGMRIVRDEAEILSSFEQATSEAARAFGDGSVYVERFVERPRHVEIQILADSSGKVVYFGERECSVQRRHQKLIEECPSPAVDPDLRRRMGEAAVRAAESVGYVGAGTVEFLLTGSDEFFFLEMNTRIQVEHPITEMVYGVDLVRWQLKIAGGEGLSMDQDAIAPRGHAIECRIIAEDPGHNFVPSPGKITYLKVPSGPGVRWDGGIEEGDRVDLFYDPMIAKLVVWAGDRTAARERMSRALGELCIAGVRTSQAFHRRVMREESFAAGDYDIGYLEGPGRDLVNGDVDREWAREVAIAAALVQHYDRTGVAHGSSRPDSNQWVMAARREGMR